MGCFTPFNTPKDLRGIKQPIQLIVERKKQSSNRDPLALFIDQKQNPKSK